MDTTQVLIVGAGPVGLTLANLLHHHGVRCKIIDQVPPRPEVESRAEGVHVRTQELFEQLGFLDEAYAMARPLKAATLYAKGHTLGHISLEEPTLTHSGPIILQQSLVEQLLISQLEKLGGSVERPLTFVGFDQTDTRVVATVQQPDGQTHTIRADYLVACDGGRSVIRHQLKAEFDGKAIPSRFVLADVSIDFTDQPLDGDLHIFMDPVLLFGQLPSGNWKMATLMPDGFPDQASPDEIVAFLQQSADAQGVRCRLHTPLWTSSFRINTRMVSQFRHGRVILAGDAAHIHSPMGGQGMNEGMQDALNLGWKLAFRLAGRADDSLLDTYQAERGPLIADVLKDTALMSEVLLWTNPIAVGLRNQFMSLVTGIDAAQPTLRELFSGATRAYAPNPYLQERTLTPSERLAHISQRVFHPDPADDLAFAKGPKPGERAPDAFGLRAANGTTQRLLTYFAGDFRHRLLVFAGQHATPDQLTKIYQQLTDLQEKRGAFLRPILVVLPGTLISETPRIETLTDTDYNLHKRYRARHECLYLLRPDGFIGYRSQPAQLPELETYLTQRYAPVS
ncbi:FAD-dependent monooxygenase [Fibrella aquatilis]|uniref:FAD-dependent monooxygenase n=1 Tax=Fibrella aquatilis TaxID=2817059 RepID=A0A939JYC5_9BACT|nr:FAD-dependent monooxygenase [Fibrella aquatilis]MBO0931944.1 FAD-dependent monooxygenase [Fibrella aquatilis]